MKKRLVSILMSMLIGLNIYQVYACETGDYYPVGEGTSIEIVMQNSQEEWIYAQQRNDEGSRLIRTTKDGVMTEVITEGEWLKWCIDDDFILYSVTPDSDRADELNWGGIAQPYQIMDELYYCNLDGTGKTKLISEGTIVNQDRAGMPALGIDPLGIYKDKVYFRIEEYLRDTDIVTGTLCAMPIRGGEITYLQSITGRIKDVIIEDNYAYLCYDNNVFQKTYTERINLATSEVEELWCEEEERISYYNANGYYTHMYDNQGELYQVQIYGTNAKLIAQDDETFWSGAYEGEHIYSGNLDIHYTPKGQALSQVIPVKEDGQETTLNFSRELIEVISTNNPNIGDLLVVGEVQSSVDSSIQCYTIQSGQMVKIPFMNAGEEIGFVCTYDTNQLFFKQCGLNVFETAVYDRMGNFLITTWEYNDLDHTFNRCEDERSMILEVFHMYKGS